MLQSGHLHCASVWRRYAGVFMAAKDPVACDVAAVALLKSIILAQGEGDCVNRDPILCTAEESIWSFWQIWRAVELGLGAGAPEDITLLTNSSDPGGLDQDLERSVLAEIANCEAPDTQWACFVEASQNR